MTNKEYAFVIPAYNPDEVLLSVVKNLQDNCNCKIFIIDDGSKFENKYIFDKLKNDESINNVYFLGHALNLGKGAALKTVFNKILTKFTSIQGVVTLDSDGQHSIKDCMRVMEELKKDDKAFVLGYRTFSKDIPFKSYIGNNISKFIYKLVLGRSFQDTQTGLRGLSKEFMKKCLSINSNRFEFETEQLAIAANQNNEINILEIPIETIYIENNKSTSFRPLVDSFKIYFVLFRYGLSSLISAIVDLIIFIIITVLGGSILSGNILGRSIGLIVNFILLRNMVFKDNQNSVRKFIIFVCYVYFMALISTFLQEYLIQHIQNLILTKILVESILFILNFSVLQTFIFHKGKK